MSNLVYVLPVHDEEEVLARNVTRLVAHFPPDSGAEVLLVENGSKDGSWRVAQELAASGDASKIPVRAFFETNAGIGYAYHRGLEESLARFGPTKDRWAVLSATDLPFGFTDLEAAKPYLDGERGSARMLVGSKAHPDSRASTGALRQAMSVVYRGARRVIVGMRIGDSQGSIFLRLDLAAELVPMIRSRGFFYSTELCHFAERAGENIVELPVILEETPRRPSTVKPLRDGLSMARQLWSLRKRAG